MPLVYVQASISPLTPLPHLASHQLLLVSMVTALPLVRSLLYMPLFSSLAQGNHSTGRTNETGRKQVQYGHRPLSPPDSTAALPSPPMLPQTLPPGASFQAPTLTMLEMLRVLAGFSMTISVVMWPSTASVISSTVQLIDGS